MVYIGVKRKYFITIGYKQVAQEIETIIFIQMFVFPAFERLSKYICLFLDVYLCINRYLSPITQTNYLLTMGYINLYE